jgi:hypothetical protein
VTAPRRRPALQGGEQSTVHIDPKYDSEPGRLFYTHICEQYAPFHTKVVNVGVRDSTYVLDSLPYHESDLCIEEHRSYHTRTALAVLCPIIVLVSYDKKAIESEDHGRRAGGDGKELSFGFHCSRK